MKMSQTLMLPSMEHGNGVVTCIERKKDKCVDIEIKTKDCKSCKYWEKRKGTDEYEIWKVTHECAINFDGSQWKVLIQWKYLNVQYRK